MKTLQKYCSLSLPLIAVLLLFISSCGNSNSGRDSSAKEISNELAITEQEVLNAQKSWSDGIVSIGKVFTEKGDYVLEATNHIDKMYSYDNGLVLFKPTMASVKQFRTDKVSALSYFVGGNPDYPEDYGFAIKPWSSIRWENAAINIYGNTALAMGNYYFTPASGGDEVKVEFSFAYVKDSTGALKIVLHDSHIPYSPKPEGH